MMILGVRLEMFRQVIDALAEQRDLDFGGTGVGSMGLVRADDFGLAILGECHVEPPRTAQRIAVVAHAHQTAVV